MNNTEDVAETLRTMLRHESEQADRRISWLSNFQGLLFAALAFAWDKDTRLVLLLAAVGLAIAVLIYCGTLAGSWAIERIRRDWRRLIPQDYKGPSAMGFYPDRAPWSVYISPENLLPLVFVIAWACVLWLSIARSGAGIDPSRCRLGMSAPLLASLSGSFR